jgi:putative N6-adenine-specific DNA methylase
LFVVVAPGLERLAAEELASIGVPAGKVRVQHGGIELQATTRQLYAIHRWARIPTRVLVRVASGTARNWDELQALVRTVDWQAYLGPAPAGVELHVASHRSVLYHQGAIGERVSAVLGRPELKGGQGVHVRLDRDRTVVSVDASGQLLHRRGWRSETHRSPLRSTIAAAMVRASGWRGDSPLVDPLAGSGTIAIEAALWAAGRPIDRPFAFQQWPSFEPGTWASVTGSGRPDALSAPVFAADRDAGAFAALERHVEGAGLIGRVTVAHAALAAQQWPAAITATTATTAATGRTVVIANPPYGHRVGGTGTGDLRDLYATLGRRASDADARLVLLAADRRLADATGLELEELFQVDNGGIPVRCLATASTAA